VFVIIFKVLNHCQLLSKVFLRVNFIYWFYTKYFKFWFESSVPENAEMWFNCCNSRDLWISRLRSNRISNWIGCIYRLTHSTMVRQNANQIGHSVVN